MQRLVVTLFSLCALPAMALTLPDGFAADGRTPARPWNGVPKTTELVRGNPQAARLAERSDARWEVGSPEPLGDGLTLVRSVCDRGAYRRFAYTLSTNRPVRLETLTFFEAPAVAQICGDTDGSVLILDNRFLAVEHPMAKFSRCTLASARWTPRTYAAKSQALPLPTLTKGDTLTVSFAYTKGSKRLDVATVRLVEKGKTLAEDRHPGYTGIARKDADYTLTVPCDVTGAQVVADYVIVDGTDSHGTITVTSARDGLRALLPLGVTLNSGESLTFSAVEGVFRPGQLRRDFQAYLEQERAHPYRVLPHYNSWYHLGLDTHNKENPLDRMTEAKCLAAMHAIAVPLAKRGVTLDSYLWDDGWDDWNTLWGYHKGFPNGFTPLANYAKAHDGGIGAWLSPWGGYNRAKAMRVAHAKAIGLPTNAGGLSLAQPKYRVAFTERCLQMIRDYGLNLFKFDGIGGGVWAKGTNAQTAPDLQGLFTHVTTLRAAKPDLFVNCTVGTWPSPFWTRWADSIWRGGSDWGMAGPGPKRERWITYRDSVIHDRFARACPLYPLNSVMLHGVIVSDTFGMAISDGADDTRAFANEVWTSVACGTNLQELYLTPTRMSPRWWDILAGGLRWLRTHETTLRDTHWHGGSPAKGEIYGYAAWSPEESIVLVRNPSDREQTWRPDWSAILELPEGASLTPTTVHLDYASTLKAVDTAGPIPLPPFETLVLRFGERP